ncbi:unnamed protein product, partial [Didymodactylos carnosus]
IITIKNRRRRKKIKNKSITTTIDSASLTITTTSITTPILITIDDHKEFILNSIKKWARDNKENLSFDELELKPDVDYILNLTDNNNIIEGLSYFTSPLESMEYNTVHGVQESAISRLECRKNPSRCRKNGNCGQKSERNIPAVLCRQGMLC